MSYWKLGAVAMGASVLSGCVGLELLMLAAPVIQTIELGGAAYNLGKVIATEQYGTATPDKKTHTFETRLNAAHTYGYNLVWWKEEGGCAFTGVVVPWAVPLEQDVNAAGAADLAVEGYAAVIYRKQCPDQPAQAVLRVGEQKTRMSAKKKQTSIHYGAQVQGQDLLVEGAEAPAWWPQVAARLVQLAPVQPAAMDFVQYAHMPLLQVVPMHTAAVKALLDAATAGTATDAPAAP